MIGGHHMRAAKHRLNMNRRIARQVFTQVLADDSRRHHAAAALCADKNGDALALIEIIVRPDTGAKGERDGNSEQQARDLPPRRDQETAPLSGCRSYFSNRATAARGEV